MRGQGKRLLIALIAVAVLVTSVPTSVLQVQAVESVSAGEVSENEERKVSDKDATVEASVSDGDAAAEITETIPTDGAEQEAIEVTMNEPVTYQATYQATADAAAVAAQQKAWSLINTYADPEFFLEDPCRSTMTDEQYEELRQFALDVTAGCTTQYQKIQAITRAVAERLYYDVPYSENLIVGMGYFYPYDVFTEKRTVCSGYARLMRTLFVSIGIPCMDLIGDNHEYNAVYDSDNDRWVHADATSCCGNKYYEDGTWERGYYYNWYFDMKPETLAAYSMYEIYWIPGLLYNGVYYEMNDNSAAPAWSDMDWHLKFSGVKENVKVAKPVGFGGLEVLEIGSDSVSMTGTGEEEWPFSDNTTLEEIDLSGTKITAVGEYEFWGCTSLKKIVFPDTLTTLEGGAFYDCTSLQSVDLSNTKLTTIAGGLFHSCSGLTEILLPETLTKIEGQAFSGCNKLTTIKIPNSVESLGFSAFHYCKALKTIDLSKTKITAINGSTFYGCDALTTVKLPNTVESIGQWAFEYCDALESIDLSNTKVTTIKDAFTMCEGLKSVKFPNTLTTIDKKAFYCCKALTEIDLSDTKVTKIGEEAFYGTSPEIIRLPSTLAELGKDAFSGGSLLEVLVVTELSKSDIGYVDEYTYGSPWFNREVTIVPYLYTVKFDGNGATSGKVSSMTCGGNKSYKLNANNFKKTNYIFAGWNTKADGSGKTYSDKDSIKNLTKTADGIVTLYAQWKKDGYTITYNLNGGKNNSKNPATYKKTSATITLKNPTRKGYTFEGWYSDKKCTKKVTKIAKGSTGNKTLYAKWAANKYTIKFNGNGSTSGKMSNLTDRKYGKSYTLTANKYKKKGYTFVGWNAKKDGSGKSYSNKASIKNLTSSNGKTVTLYAQWKKTTYKIKYNLNGGKNNSKNPTQYTVTTSTVTLKNPTKKGYTFVGWYSDKKCTKKVTKITKGSTGTKTLYAKWKKK